MTPELFCGEAAEVLAEPLRDRPVDTLAMVWGGAALLWQARRELGLLLSVYGWVNWGLILSAGRSDSSERLNLCD